MHATHTGEERRLAHLLQMHATHTGEGRRLAHLLQALRRRLRVEAMHQRLDTRGDWPLGAEGRAAVDDEVTCG